MRDEVTGLVDARLLADRIQGALARARRRGSSVAVLVIGLDRAGAADGDGDGDLTALAGCLEGALRDGDTLARTGSGELVAVCEELETDGHVTTLAKRLLDSAAALEPAPGIAIGIATAAGSEEDVEGVIVAAREAMHEARHAGGGFEIEPDLRARLRDRMQIESDLLGAAERGELRLYFQPTYSLDDGTVSSLEALLRWIHPKRGALSPSEFIDAAEQSGLIVDLGRWAIQETCRQVAAWEQNLRGAELFVSVNLSAVQLQRSDPVDIVTAAAREHGTPLERIALEIDADDLSLLEPQVIQRLRVLAAVGAGLIVDGVGDGDLPMTRMEELPLRGIRIAPTVITGLPDNPTSTSLAGAAIAAGNALHTDTIALGVETPGQVSALRELGATHVAGFLFSIPMPADRVGDVLRGHLRPAAEGGD